jgi:hypothetical protein
MHQSFEVSAVTRLQTMLANIGATWLAQWLEVPAQYRFLRALVCAADFHNPRMPQSVGSGIPEF